MRESGYYFLNINMKQNIVNSSTRSIYYNSNMAPRLLVIFIYLVWFSLGISLGICETMES